MGPILSIKLIVENFFPFVKFEAHVSIWKNIFFNINNHCMQTNFDSKLFDFIYKKLSNRILNAQ